MALGLPEVRRYARQLALPEVGTAGQERLAAGTVMIFGPDARASSGEAIAAAYLSAAGVGDVRVLPPPSDRAGWAAALPSIRGASVVMRLSLDDDDLLSLAMERDLPLLVGRASADEIALLSFRRHHPCGHPGRAKPQLAAESAIPGAGAAVLGTLVAAEAAWMLIEPDREPDAVLLRLPLGSGEPLRTSLPWPPPCPLCTAVGRSSGGAPQTRIPS